MCEETRMTAPTTVRLSASFFCWVTPENVVGMVTRREIMKRQRRQEQMRVDWRSERQRKRKRRARERERETGSRAGWCESASDHLVLLLRLLTLSLSICSTLSFFHSHLNSSPSASLQCDVGFWSTITAEMRQSRPTHAHWTQARVKSSSAS